MPLKLGVTHSLSLSAIPREGLWEGKHLKTRSIILAIDTVLHSRQKVTRHCLPGPQQIPASAASVLAQNFCPISAVQLSESLKGL